jgi:hypothetical protein
MFGSILPGTTLSYVLQRPEDDAGVLGLVRTSQGGPSRGGRGFFDIAFADHPRDLLGAPVSTSVHAVSAPRPIGDVVKHLNANEYEAVTLSPPNLHRPTSPFTTTL